MKIDPTTGKFTASYPWKQCRERMGSNKELVEKLQTRGQTDYERYTWKGSQIFLTKNQTFLIKYGIVCRFKRNMLTTEGQHFICPLNVG